jgi:hypothetical protein
MGTLGGHLLPGTFFILFAMYWSFITAIRYAQSKKRSPADKTKLVGYRTSVTMPCVCLPSRHLRRVPLESYVKAVFAFVGLLGEVITGLKFNYIPEINKDDASLFGCEEASGGHMHVHNHSHKTPVVESIHMEHVNAQHITMYAGMEKLFFLNLVFCA